MRGRKQIFGAAIGLSAALAGSRIEAAPFFHASGRFSSPAPAAEVPSIFSVPTTTIRTVEKPAPVPKAPTTVQAQELPAATTTTLPTATEASEQVASNTLDTENVIDNVLSEPLAAAGLTRQIPASNDINNADEFIVSSNNNECGYQLAVSPDTNTPGRFVVQFMVVTHKLEDILTNPLAAFKHGNAHAESPQPFSFNLGDPDTISQVASDLAAASINWCSHTFETTDQ